MTHDDLLQWSGRTACGPGGHAVALDTFGLFVELTQAVRGALFEVHQDARLSLVASRGVDQQALDLARAEWAAAEGALRAGSPMYRQAEARLFLVAPCVDGQQTCGLLYAEFDRASRRMPADHLATFSGILARALRDAEGCPERVYDDPAPQPLDNEAERENLVLVLERHDWNVSRVARLMGVTRMTVYNRLKRLSVARQRVRRNQRHSRG